MELSRPRPDTRSQEEIRRHEWGLRKSATVTITRGYKSRGTAMKFHRASPLDCYTGALGLFLFASPWLFAYASEKARIEIWASGAAVAAISVAAIIAFSNWEEWLNLLLGIWLITSPWVLGFV